jgi:hypothetical protein
LLGNVYIKIQLLETWHYVTPFRNSNVPMRCCSHLLYQQQGWWCCAVATGLIRRLVVLSNCRHARSAHPSYLNRTSTMVCGKAMNLPSFFFNGSTAVVGLSLLYEFRRSHSETHTFGRTPLDEWSACYRDLYLITHSQETGIHATGGSRTRNSVKQAAVDPSLRQRGHWIGAFWPS